MPLKSPSFSTVCALALGAALIASPVLAQNTRHARSETSAADRWGAAFNKRDLNALVALYTSDAELLPKGTRAIHGHAAIREFMRDLIAKTPTTQRTEFTHVQRFGTGNAVSEVADVETVDAQGHRTVLGRQILILLKQGGEWKVHRDMWTNNEKSPA